MTTPTWPELLTRLVARDDLTGAQTSWAMDQVMAGEVSPARLAGFLVALRCKGETVAELTALADTMLGHSLRFEVPGRTVDLVGTGGDRANTVNISTMAALVVAGDGTTVVQHGNRASSSPSRRIVLAAGLVLVGVFAGVSLAYRAGYRINPTPSVPACI